jgi:hypothetical protein
MARFYPELNDELTAFVRAQKVFFVASAPTQGRINLSPKGMDTLRCLDSRTVAYMDITGSGNETAAHVIENGRLTMMFCSFTGEPMILRLSGRGRVVHQRDAEWVALAPAFPPLTARRQIIVLDIDMVQTSCGAGVPVYEFQHERDDLLRYWAERGDEGVKAYWASNNQTSIDGLPTQLLQD